MTEQKKVVTVSRVFDAPVEKLWEYFSTPEKIMQWWGPENFTAPIIKADFKEGGKLFYCMRGVAAPGMPEMDFFNTGTFTEIVPMKKIVAEMSFADKEDNVVPASQIGMPGDWPMSVTLEIIFEKEGENQTKITVHETGIPQEVSHNASLGWSQQFDKLEKLLI